MGQYGIRNKASSKKRRESEMNVIYPGINFMEFETAVSELSIRQTKKKSVPVKMPFL